LAFHRSSDHFTDFFPFMPSSSPKAHTTLSLFPAAHAAH
jgi:hypothetical protein